MAKALNKFIISESQPKLNNVGWIKPIEGTNRCDLLFYNNGKWISEGETSLEFEDLYKRIINLEKNKQDKLTVYVTESEVFPNVYNKITPEGGTTALSLVGSTDSLPEYTGEIIFGDTVEDVIWLDNIIWDDEITYQPNCTYVFSILNGYGVMREFRRF